MPKAHKHALRSIVGRLLIASLALVVAGCGSGHPVELGSTPPTQPAFETGTTDSTTTTAQSLPEVGTITLTGNGTVVEEKFDLGSLGEGQAAAPPADVLAGCSSNISNESVIATSAFAQGEVLVTYADGSVPVEVSFHGLEPEAPGLTGITGISGHLLTDVDNTWDCNEEDSPTITLQPGETKAVSFWIILPAILTNEHPHLDQHSLDTEALISPMSVSQITTGPHETVSGPKVADCEGVKFLLPFAHLPFRVTVEAGGPMEHRISCKVAK